MVQKREILQAQKHPSQRKINPKRDKIGKQILQNPQIISNFANPPNNVKTVKKRKKPYNRLPKQRKISQHGKT